MRFASPLTRYEPSATRAPMRARASSFIATATRPGTHRLCQKVEICTSTTCWIVVAQATKPVKQRHAILRSHSRYASSITSRCYCSTTWATSTESRRSRGPLHAPGGTLRAPLVVSKNSIRAVRHSDSTSVKPPPSWSRPTSGTLARYVSVSAGPAVPRRRRCWVDQPPATRRHRLSPGRKPRPSRTVHLCVSNSQFSR